MKKSELTSIGCDYYLSIKQVATLEKCTVQNIYSRIKGKSIVFYWSNIYRVVHFGDVILLVPAERNRYFLNGTLTSLVDWQDML